MAGPRTAFFSNKHELDVHVGHIQRLVHEGLRDGETRRLAVQLVSGRFDTRRMADGQNHRVVSAWGKYFLAPPGKVCATQDDACEIEKIWDFVVLNIRYVYDTAGIDVFATLKESLISGGGDCDDLTIAFGTLLGSIGFTTYARVISLPDRPNDWAHIFPIVGVSKDDPKKWIALDASVAGARIGWSYPNPAKIKEYPLTQP